VPPVPGTLRLRVIPNARRNEVVGEYGDAVKIKIAAPALEGKANEAIRGFLAERLGVSVRAVEFVSGEKSRDKTPEYSTPQRCGTHEERALRFL
jgi:uncharacterized protein (TIGR00251 family)